MQGIKWCFKYWFWFDWDNFLLQGKRLSKEGKIKGIGLKTCQERCKNKKECGWYSYNKVRIFWEGHKIWKNLPHKIWRYWIASNIEWKIFFQILWPSQNIRTLRVKIYVFILKIAEDYQFQVQLIMFLVNQSAH